MPTWARMSQHLAGNLSLHHYWLCVEMNAPTLWGLDKITALSRCSHVPWSTMLYQQQQTHFCHVTSQYLILPSHLTACKNSTDPSETLKPVSIGKGTDLDKEQELPFNENNAENNCKSHSKSLRVALLEELVSCPITTTAPSDLNETSDFRMFMPAI